MKRTAAIVWLMVWAGVLLSPAPLRAQLPDRLWVSIHAMIEAGLYEHALRAVELNLEKYPGDERLLALRARLEQERARPAQRATLSRRTRDAPAPLAGRLPEMGRDFTLEGVEIAMLWINPGRLRLADPQGSDNDTWVTLTQGYWLGRTEVTQEQWQAVMEHMPTPSYFRGSDRPVERVTWSAALDFCRKVTERERAAGRLPDGYEYTLPTEAQWEFACRAGTSGPHAGELARLAWFAPNSSAQTHPVAQKEPNPWGFHDMHGNVWEWCLDGSGGYPGGEVEDLFIAHEGHAAGNRIVRGGAWGSNAGQCRSGYRAWVALNFSNIGYGFRLALAPRR